MHSIFAFAPLLQQCAYDTRAIIEGGTDVPNSAIVRASGGPFIAKLSSSPGLAAEAHSKDPTTVVQAQ
ncbi:hypothetical protein AURDEDRAFT_160788, partial [Auricularia subglabra TFB-10046 SS5]